MRAGVISFAVTVDLCGFGRIVKGFRAAIILQESGSSVLSFYHIDFAVSSSDLPSTGLLKYSLLPILFPKH